VIALFFAFIAEYFHFFGCTKLRQKVPGAAQKICPFSAFVPPISEQAACVMIFMCPHCISAFDAMVDLA